VRTVFEAPDDVQAANRRHLQVQEHKIRLMSRDFLQCHGAIFGFSDDLDILDGFQFFAQYPSGDWLIVHDQSSQCHRWGPVLRFF
jgi:hypothetical protein